MGETCDDRRERALGDEVIDQVARHLMAHQPAVGFGRRVAARLRDVPASHPSRGVVVLAARVGMVGVALAVVTSLWQASQRRPAPELSGPQVALQTPADSMTPPERVASETTPPAPTLVPPPAPARPMRRPSRADRLWASRGAPEVERVIVAPVPRPDPVTVQPLEVRGMAIDDLAVEPLAVDALNLDPPILQGR